MDAARPSPVDYRLLLTTLLFLFFAIPLATAVPALSWAVYIAFVAVLFASLRAVARNHRLLVPAAVLAVLTLVPFHPDPTGLLTHGPDLVFMGLIGVAIAGDVARRRQIDLDALYGAFCAYVFLGLCWGKAYAIVEASFPGSFAFGNTAPVPPFGQLLPDQLLMYLSFVTLTTVGYGDVTPLSPPARTLAVLEALVGQLFITVTIARLVGLYTAAAATTPERHDG
jgi:hypothetical protein